jgi:two-component system KDP operon response regulator KdpE
MKLKILVVDDEPQIRRQLEIALAGYGYDVVWATNGDEAIRKTAQLNPDLIVLDISLGSEPDGIEVCRSLREWSKIPVIMLSVHGEDSDQDQGAANRGGRLRHEAV